MKFFNATNKIVVGLLSLLLLLAAGELTSLLNAGEAKPAQAGPKRRRLVQRWRQPNGDGSTPMKLPSSLSTQERSFRSRP